MNICYGTIIILNVEVQKYLHLTGSLESARKKAEDEKYTSSEEVEKYKQRKIKKRKYDEDEWENDNPSSDSDEKTFNVKKSKYLVPIKNKN